MCLEDQMSNIVQSNKDNWLAIKEQAEAVKKAGLLPANMTADQAAIIVLKGQELGIGTMRALEGLYVVNGKIGMSAALVMGLIRERCPQAKVFVKRKDNKGCVIEATRPGQETETFSFTEDDARKAGLLKPNSPWDKYGSSMMWARAVTQMGRQLFSDILGAPYEKEELGGEVNEENDVQRISNADVTANTIQQPSGILHGNVHDGSERAKALNSRLSTNEVVHKEVSRDWDNFKAKKDEERKTKVTQAKPIQVNQETGEVSGYPESPAFDEAEPMPDHKPAGIDVACAEIQKKMANQILTPSPLEFVIKKGRLSGKTIQQVYEEEGIDVLMGLYATGVKKIAALEESKQPIEQASMEALDNLEKAIDLLSI